ncbi:hypothetical protein, partial [Exiguobacterium sp.]
LGQREEALKKVLDAYSDSLLRQMDAVYRQLIEKINATFARYHSLIDAAFDMEANSASLAAASISLAEALDVSSSKILHTHEELDDFFLS